MRIAFKEWAVIVDALGRGEQIVVFRKGGLRESRGGFQLEHKSFLLFPTRFHQQRECVLEAAQGRFDQVQLAPPPPGIVRLEFYAEVLAWRRLESFAQAGALRGQHFWRDEVIAERFDWGKEKAIFALAVRVLRLRAPAELPVIPSYGGCKSWVELQTDIPTDKSAPVLGDDESAKKLSEFRMALKFDDAGGQGTGLPTASLIRRC